MNEDTKRLLEECTSGCKMAVDSIDQIKSYVDDKKLLELLSKYKEKHQVIEEEAGEILKNSGREEKEPGLMAGTFSWITTEMKMMIRNDSHQVAKLMMDGCNMGIQSISEYENQYNCASTEARNLTRKLVKVEEDFMGEMKEFL